MEYDVAKLKPLLGGGPQYAVDVPTSHPWAGPCSQRLGSPRALTVSGTAPPQKTNTFKKDRVLWPLTIVSNVILMCRITHSLWYAHQYTFYLAGPVHIFISQVLECLVFRSIIFLLRGKPADGQLQLLQTEHSSVSVPTHPHHTTTKIALSNNKHFDGPHNIYVIHSQLRSYSYTCNYSLYM